MKKTQLKYLFLFLLSFSVFVSCEDDPEETISVFVGDYVITEALVAEEITLVTTTPGVTIPIPAETDITQAIQVALLGEVQCTPDKSIIELREDNSMFLSCDGVDELDAGTWEEIDITTIKLNMNAAAVPASIVGVSLTVENITLTGSILSGETAVPLPGEMFAPMLPEGLVLDPAHSAVIYVKLKLTLTKQ